MEQEEDLFRSNTLWNEYVDYRCLSVAILSVLLISEEVGETGRIIRKGASGGAKFR